MPASPVGPCRPTPQNPTFGEASIGLRKYFSTPMLFQTHRVYMGAVAMRPLSARTTCNSYTTVVLTISREGVRPTFGTRYIRVPSPGTARDPTFHRHGSFQQGRGGPTEEDFFSSAISPAVRPSKEFFPSQTESSRRVPDYPGPAGLTRMKKSEPSPSMSRAPSDTPSRLLATALWRR